MSFKQNFSIAGLKIVFLGPFGALLSILWWFYKKKKASKANVSAV